MEWGENTDTPTLALDKYQVLGTALKKTYNAKASKIMKKSQCSVDVKMETSTEIASPPLFKFAANALSLPNRCERIEDKCCQLFDTWAEEVHADYVRSRDKEEDELEV